jgi:hypothetical protein
VKLKDNIFMVRASFLILMLCLGFVTNSSSAQAKPLPTSQKEILKEFPKDLSSLSWRSQQNNVKAVLGEPAEKENHGLDAFWHYSLSGGLYDTTFTFHEGQLKSISFLVPYGKWVAADFQKFFSAEELKKAEIHRSQATHTSGDEFIVTQRKHGLSVTINRDRTFSVRRILLWPPGENQP